MFDPRPVLYVIGLLILALGVTMLVPLGIDLWRGNGFGAVFLQSSLFTILFGGLLSMATANSVQRGLNLKQTFMLTTGVWIILPIFGAIPFMLGETDAGFTDAFFEAMSGLTTTGSTVFSGLDSLQEGIILWRAILQWLGGIGIIVVAMVFLPELRVGGMQVFRSEGFDTFGKILPRATEIASRVAVIYVGLTAICAIAYLASGMAQLDAAVHAMTTIATGGFSSRDGSFSDFGAATEYVAALFMLLAALPFVRYVQLLDNRAAPFFQDSQIRGFLVILGVIVTALVVFQWVHQDRLGEESLRKSLFNATSIVTGTGFASADYMRWGGFAIAVFFFAGLIGGCAGSTSCSVKVFRYQILFGAIRTQLRRLHSPSGIFITRYQGNKLGDDILDSVISFFVVFFFTLVIVAIALSLTGLDLLTSVSGAVAALANIGPGLGDQIGPTGNYAGLPDASKWILLSAMLVGRLELLAVYAFFTLRFWRD